MSDIKQLSGSEAVYGFVAWLSCRSEVTKFGSKNDCAPLAELVKEFCDTNKLKEPRKNWHKALTHPK